MTAPRTVPAGLDLVWIRVTETLTYGGDEQIRRTFDMLVSPSTEDAYRRQIGRHQARARMGGMSGYRIETVERLTTRPCPPIDDRQEVPA